MRHLRPRGGVPIRTIAIALGLLLAGCVSAEDEPVESADIRADATQSSDAGAAPQPTAQPVSSSTGTIATPVSFPFAYEGRTGTGVCAPAGPSSCVGTTVEDSENLFMPLEHDGAARGVIATLTWTAQTPAAEEMYIVAFAMISCGGDCIEVVGDGVIVSGMSPLTLDAPDLARGENATIGLRVDWVRPTPPLPQPLYYTYSIEQPFAVEGMVTAHVNGSA